MSEKIKHWEQTQLRSQISLDIINLHSSVRADIFLSTPSNLDCFLEQTQETELGKITNVTATDSPCDLPSACPACLKINQSNSQPTLHDPHTFCVAFSWDSVLRSYMLSLNGDRHLPPVQLERAINFTLLSNTPHLVPCLSSLNTC